MDANRERCRKPSREMYSVLARYTSSEALTIVKSVTELDGVGAWARLHANQSRRELGRMFTVQRECMYPKPAKDVGQVRLAIMQGEKKWKGMMSELGGDAKIPDLWRMSALLEICPNDVKELMRLDEIGENYANLKAKVISYTTNKAEQARGGQRETVIPMELDHVSGAELYDEMGNAKGRGQNGERSGKEVCRQVRRLQGRTEKVGDIEDSAGRVARLDTSRRNVDGKLTMCG